MSWTKKNVHPGKIVSHLAGSRRASCWTWTREAPHLAGPQAGRTIRGTPSSPKTRSVRPSKARVKNITEFGLFIGLDNDSTAWSTCPTSTGTSPAKKPSSATRRATWSRRGSGRRRREGTHLARHQAARRRPDGRRHLQEGPDRHRHRDVITTGGIEVSFGEEARPMTAFIRKSDLSRDRAEQRPERYRGRRPRRRHGDRHRQGEPARSRCRSRRWKWPTRRKPSSSSARRTRALRSATSSALRFARRRPRNSSGGRNRGFRLTSAPSGKPGGAFVCPRARRAKNPQNRNYRGW
jgi:hypothetical protein